MLGPTDDTGVGAAVRRLAAAIAPALPMTPDVSQHLLRRASRGLPGQPLYDLNACFCFFASFSYVLLRSTRSGTACG